MKLGVSWWLSGKVSACQCRRHGFDPWSRKIPHALEKLSLPTTTIEPVLWRRCSSRKEVTATRRLWIAARESPPLTASREKPEQQRRPSRDRNKQLFINLKKIGNWKGSSVIWMKEDDKKRSRTNHQRRSNIGNLGRERDLIKKIEKEWPEKWKENQECGFPAKWRTEVWWESV